MSTNKWPLLCKFVLKIHLELRWSQITGIAQKAIARMDYDFAELFRTVWQRQMHLRGHFPFHFMPKMSLKWQGMVIWRRAQNVLSWHRISLQKASSCEDTLSILSPESFIKFILCFYSIKFSRKTLTLHFSPLFFPSPFSLVSLLFRHPLFQECWWAFPTLLIWLL